MREEIGVGLRDLVLGGALDLVPKDLAVLGVVGKQVVNDHLLGRLAHPLEQREVAELVGLEDLEHLNGLVANVLDKVAHVAGHDADVAGHVVKGAGGALGTKDGDAGAALDEEGPLVGVGVPVHLTDGSRLDGDVGGGHGLGNGEVLGVGDAHLASCGLLWLLLQHAMREVVLGLLDILAARLLVANRTGKGALEDVLLAVGNVREDLGCQVKVL